MQQVFSHDSKYMARGASMEITHHNLYRLHPVTQAQWVAHKLLSGKEGNSRSSVRDWRQKGSKETSPFHWVGTGQNGPLRFAVVFCNQHCFSTPLVLFWMDNLHAKERKQVGKLQAGIHYMAHSRLPSSTLVRHLTSHASALSPPSVVLVLDDPCSRTR